ncbi:uncharacterized protein BDW47DRAFT_103754 [Aspergillus candidus]|uniref:Uncharacterized protein n=1 Tax=Aspergillus candidus TaxID=41067 RepID=A0A2I2FEY6_ASPCN|nr:hypothetical protein BDW47DRAFT_103754 [Aspergillus candidus]PLB39149.1 hypothetical protein BDW47DRAFT_103754 [Aspergillus candidus]
MAPTRPTLRPLKTPKNMNMSFPSELRERPYLTCLDRPCEDMKKEDLDTEVSITPPPAYTEFLNTFSPIFSSPSHSRANFSKYMHDRPRASPVSTPSSATSTTFSGHLPRSASSLHPPPSAASYSPRSPDHVRRLRLPPPYLYTPVSDSPRSAHPLRSLHSPSDWRVRPYDSPVSENGHTLSVRHVVTTTITLKRAPQLDPPPQGKRRRNVDRRNV